MSASMLHYAHKVRGVQYESTQYSDGSVFFFARLDQAKEKCPSCGSLYLHFKDSLERRFQMCPIGNMPCWLYLTLIRVDTARIANLSGGLDLRLYQVNGA